jgi:hypothetical protein
MPRRRLWHPPLLRHDEVHAHHLPVSWLGHADGAKPLLVSMARRNLREPRLVRPRAQGPARLARLGRELGRT